MRKLTILAFLSFLAIGSIRCSSPTPRVEPTRPPIQDLRVGLVVELTGTTDIYQVWHLFETNRRLRLACSPIRKQELLDPLQLDPGDEVRYLGDWQVVVETGRYQGQIGWIIPGELR